MRWPGRGDAESRFGPPGSTEDGPSESKRNDSELAESESAARTRAHLEFDCADCGHLLGSPVAFAVVEHPAVVGFFEARGIDIRERPLWNLGEEWSETVLSTEPWCVRVSVRIDGDRLDVLVGNGPTLRVLD